MQPTARSATLDLRHMSAALLKICRTCDSDCRFCHTGGPQKSTLSINEICHRVLDVKREGGQTIILSGGEPTTHPDFLKICRFIRRAGLSFGLVSNGRRLASAPLRDALVALGPVRVTLSLHGPTAGIHDRLAGVPSFAEVTSTITALSVQTEIDLWITTVVCDDNLEVLPEVVRLIDRLTHCRPPSRPVRLRLALLEPKGRALELGSPPLTFAAAAVSQAVASGRRRCPRVLVGWDGFPSCLAPAGVDRRFDLGTQEVRWMREPDEDRLFPVDHGARCYPVPCRRCLLRPRCPGVYEIRRDADTGALSPHIEARPRAIRCLPVGSVPANPGPSCPLLVEAEIQREQPDGQRRSVGPWSAPFLRESPTSAVVYEPVAPVDAVEITRIAALDGQIRALGSRSSRLDFVSACLECPRWGRCPGVVETVTAALDRLRSPDTCWLEEARDSIVGRAGLDLSEVAGEDPLWSQLVGAARARSGSWRPASVDELGPLARVGAAVALETLTPKGHPWLALRRLAGVLEPGGILLMTGRVRMLSYCQDHGPREVSRPGLSGPHWLRSSDFLPDLVELTPLTHAPVRPAGPARWMMSLKKTED